MDKNDLLKQYDRFISQLHIEVDQMFWLYNFFFAIDSALMGIIFLKKTDGLSLLFIIIIGFVFSIYWDYIMRKKNSWRENWLRRINDIEKNEIIKIPEEFQMWPKNIGTKSGLWKKLFWLPKGFIITWIIIIFIYIIRLFN